jgi:hypothetical protein
VYRSEDVPKVVAQSPTPLVVMQHQLHRFEHESEDALIIKAQSCDHSAHDWRKQVNLQR